MKRFVAICSALILVISLFFISCVTDLDNDIQPYWYDESQLKISSRRMAFMGEGRAETERQALLLAYSDLNENLYKYLKTALEQKQETYKELSLNEKIKRYNLNIIERNLVEKDGEYTIYLLATASKKKILQVKKQSENQIEIANQVEKLIHQGDEQIKNNNDIAGLKYYLQSMELSYGNDEIEKEYSFNEILNEVMYIINTTEIVISDEDPKNAICKVRVLRHDSIIPSRIDGAPISASYIAIDSQNREYRDVFNFTTSKNGENQFSPKNHLIKKTGTVKFTINIDDELNRLLKKDPETAKLIQDAIQKKSNEFVYDKNNENRIVKFCIFEQALDGEYTNSDRLNTILAKKFEDTEEIEIIQTEHTYNDIEILTNLQKEHKQTYYIISRVGILDIVKSKNNLCVATTEGNVVIYNNDTKKIFDSDIAYTNGFGKTEEDATEQAYKNFLLLVYSFIKAHCI